MGEAVVSVTVPVAPDTAEAVCDISRVGARRCLEYLSVTGQAVVTLRYGQTGRPERRYHWHT